jgi:uncharacterized protein RhaS with RHS repeats
MSPVTKPRGPVNPYGKVTAHSGTTTTQLQYNGQYSDPESGLLNLRARYYDPGTESSRRVRTLMMLGPAPRRGLGVDGSRRPRVLLE